MQTTDGWTIQPRASRPVVLLSIALILVLASACGDPGGPAPRKTTIATLAGDAQFGVEGATLTESLQVVVTDAVTDEPVEDVRVDWQVVSGNGSVTPASSTTDTRGIASVNLRLGESLGSVQVRATSANLVGEPAVFTAFSVLPPAISAITPTAARAGDTITINGFNFGTSAGITSVLFDGIRGLIVSIAADRIRVVVPACVATDNTEVKVSLGAVMSSAMQVATTAGNTAPLRLERGQVRVFADPAEVACIRLPPDPAGASYLVITQNVAETYSIGMPLELAGLTVVPPTTAILAGFGTAQSNFADAWELRLRERERAMIAATRDDVFDRPAVRATPAIPVVGERRSFNTLNSKNETVKITAEVRAVTDRAILYQDVNAANVLTNADYERFGDLFDDPIYTTETNAFGQVGDIDGNNRIIMVFTPQVNALTAKGTGSYIAGYFYACDLLPRSRCDASNGGEIFYSMVPDPTGSFSDPHSATQVLRVVPPVLAHEFMHMINFGERGGTTDVLWLGEALAHTAEDVVGKVILDRGDALLGSEFVSQNHLHARVFLSNTSRTSLIADERPGSVDLRGAGWLFLLYLRGLYGENELLRSLTSAKETGSRNITARTGRSWPSLLSDFATAIYADDAPTLTGVPLDPRYTFVNTNLRTLLGTAAPFPLVLRNFSFNDFFLSGALPSSAWHYSYVQAPSTGSSNSLNLVFSGARGGPFISAGAPQLTILRVR